MAGWGMGGSCRCCSLRSRIRGRARGALDVGMRWVAGGGRCTDELNGCDWSEVGEALC